MIIKREVIDRIEKFVNDKEIIALVGLRQVGKTTLLNYFKQKLDKSIYVSFNDISLLNLFENNIDEFIQIYVKNYDYIFIDEVQYSTIAGKQLKYIYDKEKIKIFVSGSSKSEIALHALKYLVGRVIIFEIYPLSFREFVSYKDNSLMKFLDDMPTEYKFLKLRSLFDQYLKYGGYPEIVLENDYYKKEIKLKSIVNIYLLKEIKEILQISNFSQYQILLESIAVNDGFLLNKSNLASELKINRNKIDEMINVLEQTGIITILKPYLKNKFKELVRTPKVYLNDLGFKNSLLNNFNEVVLRKDKGEIYESFVLSQLIRNEYEIKFWRVEDKYEMDFVIEKNNKLIGFEVKSNLSKTVITNSTKKFIELEKPYFVYICSENLYGSFENYEFTNYFISLKKELI